MNRKIPNIVVADRLGRDEFRGEIEFEVKDRHGRIIHTHREPNLIKIFSKEMLSHRIAPTSVWDPAAAGTGAYVPSQVDLGDEFSIKYVLLGASFDENGIPMGPDDTRYYSKDPVTGAYVPNALEPGATDDGGLINAIPIAEPDRPLKRVESVYFEPSYQPTSVPLLDSDVRAMNNVLVIETTLEVDEYNGMGLTDSDYFTITEVALAGGVELGSVGTFECVPSELFLEGSSDADAIAITMNGSNVVTIDAGDAGDASVVADGDQIKLVTAGSTVGTQGSLGDVSPYYLVTDKSETGLEVTLDRVPVTAEGVAMTGSAGMFRDTLRLFSHRILSYPVQKSGSLEITIRWRIIFS